MFVYVLIEFGLEIGVGKRVVIADFAATATRRRVSRREPWAMLRKWWQKFFRDAKPGRPRREVWDRQRNSINFRNS